MRREKKIMAVGMVFVVLFAAVEPVSAKEAASEKEEVVYIMTDSAGNVQSVNVVNIFSGGDVTDYGNYTAVRMMNTDAAIQSEGDQITFSTEEKRVYYQGTLGDAEMPWNISIRYFLDGREYAADEIAGKSGSLEIRFSVSKNEACRAAYYEDYALQAVFTLETEKCSNIEAEDATIANVGKDKQLTYTILPGEGIRTTISADVEDFSMDAVSINGIRLNLQVDVDEDALRGRMDDMASAVDEAKDGAGKLSDGAKELTDATDELKQKTGQLHDGVGQLSDGAGILSEGLSALAARNEALQNGAYQAFQGLCSAAGGMLNSQLSANGMATVTLTPENYGEVLNGVLAKLGTDAAYTQAYNTALTTVTAQVEAQGDALYETYVNSNADSICYAYVKSNEDALYQQAAAGSIKAQLMQQGMDESAADAYLQTAEGQQSVARTAAGFDEEQKQQILGTAAASLTEEQRQQILTGSLASLTEEQKVQIREGAITQLMAGESVTSKISEAVGKVNAAAGQVASLKGQLDSYQAFYSGLKEYTAYVSDAAEGVGTLNSGLQELGENTGLMSDAAGTLHTKMNEMSDGAGELSLGMNEFSEKMEDAETEIDDQISSVLDTLSGSNEEVYSFVSEKNTNVLSVQFVIKTAAIEEKEEAAEEVQEESKPTFWEKLLGLGSFFK